MTISLNVLFKKMQKDDKKEVLHFQVQGDEMPHAQQLVEMAGGIVIMDVEGCEAGEMNAEFASLQRDSKKTVLKMNIKGDSEDKAIKLYRHAGRNVTLNLKPAQMSIDEYYNDETHEGIEYTVNPDGTVDVDVDENQLSIDDLDASEPVAAAENVADLAEERQKRNRKKKEAEPESVPFADDDALPAANDDDEFPF